VDEEHVDTYRLTLAMEGMMPENSTGYEIFDDTGMMVTDEDRKIMYQRALEGELQRSIMSLAEIQSSRVHLVMSEESIFDTERTQATASVVVDVRAGMSLSADSVRGIIALVSGAVDQLPEKNVTVVDSSGNLLSAGISGDDDFQGSSIIETHQEIKRNFEKEIEKNIQTLLGPAFGPEKIKVSVYADLDFDAQEQTVIEYEQDPENPIRRSQQYSAYGPDLEEGAIMVGPIEDNVQNVLDDGEEDNLSSFDGIANYEVDETRTNIVKAPGQVTKLSTSVLYDGNLTEAEENSIRNLVSTATGYDAERGDLINIEGVVFDTEYQEQMDEELERIRAEAEANRTFFDRYGDYIFYGIFALLGLLMLIMIMRILFGRKKKTEEAEQAAMAAEQQPVTDDPVEAIESVKDRFEVKEDQREKDIKDYAKEHPEAAADLIKAWMKK
ncbi:MAG TPA: flagellar M-ring protein FliF, partial [Eubacteriaceae bacterium]|nr:flagellar M-ring protein FliF [Eubacteriaceae bacterium]